MYVHALFVLLAVAAAGCGKVTEDPPDHRRLVARQLRAPGVPPVFWGMYDRKQQLTCNFHIAGDGRLRCLPVRNLLWLYEDAQCSISIYGQRSSRTACVPVRHLAETRGCGVHLYEAVAQRLTGQTIIDPETCEPEAVDEATDYFAAGQEIDPEFFVTGAEILERRTSLFSQWIVESEDGARELRPLVFSETGMLLGCGLESSYGEGLDDLTCFPNPTVFVATRYRDAECQDPIDVGVSLIPCWHTSRLIPGFAVEGSVLEGGERRYVELGEEISQPLFYRQADDGCLPSEHQAHYALGAEVSFPEVSFQARRLGTGRLQRVFYHHEDVPLFGGPWYDRQLEEACEPTETTDGNRRCFPVRARGVTDPSSSFDSNAYADSDRRELLTPGSPDDPDVPPARWAITSAFDDCLEHPFGRGRVSAAYRVGERHQGPIYTRSSSPQDPGNTPYFRLHPVPLSDFPVLELAME